MAKAFLHKLQEKDPGSEAEDAPAESADWDEPPAAVWSRGAGLPAELGLAAFSISSGRLVASSSGTTACSLAFSGFSSSGSTLLGGLCTDSSPIFSISSSVRGAHRLFCWSLMMAAFFSRALWRMVRAEREALFGAET